MWSMHKNYIHAIDYICWTQMGKKKQPSRRRKKAKRRSRRRTKKKSGKRKKDEFKRKLLFEASERVSELALQANECTRMREQSKAHSHPRTKENVQEKKNVWKTVCIYYYYYYFSVCIFFSLYVSFWCRSPSHLPLIARVGSPHTCSLSLSSIAASTMHPAYGKHTQYIYEINSKYKEEHTTM